MDVEVTTNVFIMHLKIVISCHILKLFVFSYVAGKCQNQTGLGIGLSNMHNQILFHVYFVIGEIE